MNGSEQIRDMRVKTIGGAVLLLWLVLSFVLGASDAFVRAPGAFPLRILAGLLTPIFVFLIAFWTVGPFRDFVMSIDLTVITGIQAWRFGGLGFIALYAYGVLPGLFAWPAGLGDMAIGLTAPLVILALRRKPAFAANRLLGLEPAGDIRPRCCSGPRSAEFSTGHRYFRPDSDFPDGDNAAGYGSCVLGSAFSHAPSRFAFSGETTCDGREGMQLDGADAQMRTR